MSRPRNSLSHLAQTRWYSCGLLALQKAAQRARASFPKTTFALDVSTRNPLARPAFAGTRCEKKMKSAGARKLDLMSRVDLLCLISCVYTVSEDSDVNRGHAAIRQAKRF
jgi:hypothetical protein